MTRPSHARPQAGRGRRERPTPEPAEAIRGFFTTIRKLGARARGEPAQAAGADRNGSRQ
ncbi:MAG: hypothetical protein J0H41_02635 [Rhizobiales bacterium]|mgnify:CR=1 FL=1|nr:hypothetical protein [Hyphomicrobiales bacterium]